jgi:hypothetical protein
MVLLWRDRRSGMLITVTSSALLLIATIGGGILPALDTLKAPRTLAIVGHSLQRQEEIRLASYHYTRPSLVFYSQREVHQLDTEEEVESFLSGPLPAYLFITEPDWQQARRAWPDMPGKVVARTWDLYRNCNAVVVSNQEK